MHNYGFLDDSSHRTISTVLYSSCKCIIRTICTPSHIKLCTVYVATPNKY